MSLMEKFADPSTIHDLTVFEKLGGAGVTALMGMGVTFSILFLLWGLIVVLTKIIGEKPKKIDETKVATEVAPVVTKAQTLEEPTMDLSKDQELISVIMAAIAAYDDKAVISDLVVKRISRASGRQVAWSSAGRNESIDSRRMY